MLLYQRASTEVYPRPRGGACSPVWWRSVRHGLSPPTRGSPRHALRNQRGGRSIPAHAGGAVHATTREGAHAGECHRQGHVSVYSGLSPPTRGSPGRIAGRVGGAGSIPAHAGEPYSPPNDTDPCRVYPRPRGGARRSLVDGSSLAGLSPPTRGSPVSLQNPARSLRSIPAHAGEPPRLPRAQVRAKVYPRPRGGAAPDALRSLMMSGSIPAHAGEPALHLDKEISARVYPRPRGGAR